MLIAMHSKEPTTHKDKIRYSRSKAVRGSVDILGLPLSCIIIDGKFFFSVIEYVGKCYKHKNCKYGAGASWYYQWKCRYSELLHGNGGGIVVALPSGYYGNLEYLQTITKALGVVSEGNSSFTTDVAEYAEAVIAIYRGIFTPPSVVDSKAGFTWDDFYEVEHKTLVCTPVQSSKKAGADASVNVPVKKPHFLGGYGIKYPEAPEDMPEVITRNHPVTTVDTIKETETAPVKKEDGKRAIFDNVVVDTAVIPTTTAVTSTAVAADAVKESLGGEVTGVLGGIGAVLGQLVGGKKIKLTVTLELE